MIAVDTSALIAILFAEQEAEAFRHRLAAEPARVSAVSLQETSMVLATRLGDATAWQELDLDTAMGMIAGRVLEARRKSWQDTDEQGNKLRRTMGIASLGGATLDNEENYLIKKLFTAMGAIQIENQARI